MEQICARLVKHEEKFMNCKKHGNCLHIMDVDGRWRCKKCRVNYVQEKRERIKRTLVEYKGGKCDICGYIGYPNVYDFHHMNPTKKDFGISSSNGYCKSLSILKSEVDKCALLCCRCHREVHYLMKYNPNLSYNEIRESLIKEPLVDSSCIEHMPKRDNIKIEKDTLIQDLLNIGSYVGVGKKYGMSDNGIRKWCKKYDIPTHKKELRKYLGG